MDGAESSAASVAPSYRRLRESAFCIGDPTSTVQPVGAMATSLAGAAQRCC